MTIRTLLVANRGEIASRVFRTCRERGIGTVAVFSDADADLPYVAEADVAVRLPGTSPTDTYLRADLLVDAARRTGADAVHPGYGFLSENADFARAVQAAGLTWVGPRPATIDAMGSKVEAKRIAARAGVPVLSVTDPTQADLPLLVKASAGGGGRGMRVVRDLAALDAEVAAAREEAASAFGDGTVFVEPYVERGRHVEVQVWGDAAGVNVSVLGARDCSLQRRHQKVVEEAPPPDLADEELQALYDAAEAIARAVDYVGVGTVEFLVDADPDRDLDEEGQEARFWFLEMNTRLQVEHPVTEEVTGLDLVGLQLDAAVETAWGVGIGFAVSRGEESSLVRRASGHAVEVRLYAEDPVEDHRPTSGLLTAFEIPASEGIRVESGYAAGCEVSVHYDAMLAKVVAHGDDRDQAVQRLAGALSRARIHGVRTNRDQLVQLLREPDFLAERVSTAFLADHPPVATTADPGVVVAAALAVVETARARARVQTRVPAGWRSVTSAPQTVGFDGEEPVSWWGGRDGYVVDGVTVVAASPTRVTLERDGVRASYATTVRGLPGHETVDVDRPGGGHAHLVRTPRFTDPADAVASGSLTASMPGTVVRLDAAVGDVVVAGQPLLVLEAMKMQHTVSAPADGVVTTVAVEQGRQVAAGEVLVVVEADPAAGPGDDEGDES